MKGFLMQEKTFIRGEDTFVESFSPENNYAVIFEDDGDTAYFYALETDPEKNEQKIVDALHIYETEQNGEEKKLSRLIIIWSKDWLKCALVIDDQCHAVFRVAGGRDLQFRL